MSKLMMSDLPDCLDNSCFFSHYSEKRVGMRTNGGCRCSIHEVKRQFHIQNLQLAAAKAEIAEYRELLEQIVDMNAMPPYQLGIIERLLAKHKGE